MRYKFDYILHAGPAPTHYFSPTRIGSGATLSQAGTVVTANAIHNAIAYTSNAIPVGKIFQIKCLTVGTLVSSFALMTHCSRSQS